MKTYLGDGVYAQIDQWGRIVLTTENGVRTTNVIVLEADVYRSLNSWVERLPGEEESA